MEEIKDRQKPVPTESDPHKQIKFGYLNLNSYAGVTSHRVEVIGETTKRLRIKAIDKTKLAGRQRWLRPGETTLVPKYAITDAPINK